MTTYLLNSLPNSILIPEPYEVREILGLSEENAKLALILDDSFVSAIGHQSTAEMLSKRLDLPVAANRIQITPSKGDVLIVATFNSPRRLNEGEMWTEQEILGFDVRYCKIVY